MSRWKKERGFTLIEILLVVTIIGIMLAVIVPRAWRANIDSKYGLVRQNCSELAAFGHEWAEEQLLAQSEQFSTATIDSYFITLTGVGVYATNAAWVANQTTSNWNKVGWTGNPIEITGRNMTATGQNLAPEASVEDIVPPEKIPRNPFNNVSVFAVSNYPTGNVITGAIACGTIAEGTTPDQWHYYAFLFQGTDSSTVTTNTAASYHAGQDPATLAGLRNGIFFARLRP
jgi:prepilin-type N-terminal cleavage/methylation domain-containing protein